MILKRDGGCLKGWWMFKGLAWSKRKQLQRHYCEWQKRFIFTGDSEQHGHLELPLSCPALALQYDAIFPARPFIIITKEQISFAINHFCFCFFFLFLSAAL
jgi:hypothetical protein